MAGVASSNRQRSKIAPYLMILPALIYLGVFYLVPFVSLFRTSMSTMSGSIYLPTLTFAWEFGNYGRALSEYRDQILRSFGYAFAATLLCLLLAFPLAYVIAFKAGRFKNLLLGLVILPFFVTASLDLGAGPIRTFFRVTLPLIVPGIVAAAMLSFALSLDDYFISGSTVTYPLYVNAATKAALPPQINVLATAILLISLILLIAGTLYRRKRVIL